MDPSCVFSESSHASPKLSLEIRLSPDTPAVRVQFVHNIRARRYLMRMKRGPLVRVTIPRGGNLVEARQFIERHTSWLLLQQIKLAALPVAPRIWEHGSRIWYRGCQVALEVDAPNSIIRFADQTIVCHQPPQNLRPIIEGHLRQISEKELTQRVNELRKAFRFKKIQVRGQKSRWGSCSARGTISLNWRLIQTPDYVLDYLIIHELAHTVHMNHSPQFWILVERLMPSYYQAKRWLRLHGSKIIRSAD